MCNACEEAIDEAVAKLLADMERGTIEINGEEISYENARPSADPQVSARVE